MNRKERRLIEKDMRKAGLSKTMAKVMTNYHYRGEAYAKGQKCKLNYELIKRHPDFKKQTDDFREWVISHAQDILTVDDIRSDGHEVTFVEDENENKYWHHTETLLSVTTAAITLNDGTTKTIAIDGVQSPNDPKIQQEINKALEENDCVCID